MKLLRSIIRETPLWPLLRPRRIHVYGIGAAKTGTKSIAKLFESEFRTRHEPYVAETVKIIERMQHGSMKDHEIRDFLVHRDRKNRLEVESSQLLVHFLPQLVEMFPESKFIFPIREPHSWLRSIIDQNINNRMPRDIPEDSVPPFRTYSIIKFGEEPGGPYPPEEKALADYAEDGVYSIDGYLSNWAWHNRTVLEQIPPDRLLAINTSEISNSVNRIAQFVGVPPVRLSERKSHVHQASKKHNVLQKIDQSYLDMKIEEHCGEVMRLVEEKTSVVLK